MEEEEGGGRKKKTSSCLAATSQGKLKAPQRPEKAPKVLIQPSHAGLAPRAESHAERKKSGQGEEGRGAELRGGEGN
eukprot:232006-Hanusia_phi.AAC.1